MFVVIIEIKALSTSWSTFLFLVLEYSFLNIFIAFNFPEGTSEIGKRTLNHPIVSNGQIYIFFQVLDVFHGSIVLYFLNRFQIEFKVGHKLMG